MPITEQERLVAKEQGSSHLIAQLASEHRSWIVAGREDGIVRGDDPPGPPDSRGGISP
jgi:hypothetical protein